MITALILDFDGLLVDTETPAFESWRRVYAEHGHELSMDLWASALGSNDGFNPLTHLLSLARQQQPPLILDEAQVRAHREDLKHRLNANLPLLPGVLELLDQADALKMPCAIASSSTRAWVEGWLRHHTIYERFVCVRTADDVAATKPAPDLFLSAAACMGVAPAQCLVFEDSPNGIRAAQAAGMHAVAIPGAISRQVPWPEVRLILPSLHAIPLLDILSQVGN